MEGKSLLATLGVYGHRMYTGMSKMPRTHFDEMKFRDVCKNCLIKNTAANNKAI